VVARGPLITTKTVRPRMGCRSEHGSIRSRGFLNVYVTFQPPRPSTLSLMIRRRRVRKPLV
jgi:hypothetical protein